MLHRLPWSHTGVSKNRILCLLAQVLEALASNNDKVPLQLPEMGTKHLPSK